MHSLSHSMCHKKKFKKNEETFNSLNKGQAFVRKKDPMVVELENEILRMHFTINTHELSQKVYHDSLFKNLHYYINELERTDIDPALRNLYESRLDFYGPEIPAHDFQWRTESKRLNAELKSLYDQLDSLKKELVMQRA